MANDKIIKMNVGETELVAIDDLQEFQGELKELSEESYIQMRDSILKHGISFTKHAWKAKGKYWIIDGHQTKKVLVRMRDDEGFKVPKVSVTMIKANGIQEAKELLLIAASQYGEVTNQGVFQFMTENGISMDRLKMIARMPEIDFGKFQQSYFPDGKTVTFKAKIGAKEIDEGEFSKFDHTCPKCKFSFNDKR